MSQGKLTAKQEHFARLVAAGGTYSDAYRGAYEVGVDTAAQTVWVKSSQIAASDKVGTRVAELRQAAEDQVVDKMAWNLERLIQEAEINLNSARQAKQFGSANGALEMISRVAGLLDNKGRQAVQVKQVVIHAGGGVEERQAVEGGYRELTEQLDEDAS